MDAGWKDNMRKQGRRSGLFEGERAHSRYNKHSYCPVWKPHAACSLGVFLLLLLPLRRPSQVIASQQTPEVTSQIRITAPPTSPGDSQRLQSTRGLSSFSSAPDQPILLPRLMTWVYAGLPLPVREPLSFATTRNDSPAGQVDRRRPKCEGDFENKANIEASKTMAAT